MGIYTIYIQGARLAGLYADRHKTYMNIQARQTYIYAYRIDSETCYGKISQDNDDLHCN